MGRWVYYSVNEAGTWYRTQRRGFGKAFDHRLKEIVQGIELFELYYEKWVKDNCYLMS